MDKLAVTWLRLGVTGVIIVNLVNFGVSFLFGTLHAYLNLVAGMSLVLTAVVILTARALYSRVRMKVAFPPSVPPKIKPKRIKRVAKKTDETVIYGQPSIGGAASSLRLPSGEIRCGNCGVINNPKAKHCKNCGSTL